MTYCSAGHPVYWRTGARVGVPKSPRGDAAKRGSSAFFDPAKVVQSRNGNGSTLDIQREDPTQAGWKVGTFNKRQPEERIVK